VKNVVFFCFFLGSALLMWLFLLVGVVVVVWEDLGSTLISLLCCGGALMCLLAVYKQRLKLWRSSPPFRGLGERLGIL
jgi:peptidoglycan/LPS O-acetylase OafA/YrhL